MYHSITFIVGDEKRNTWEDWKLIPSSPPFIQPFPIRKKFVELPGGDGSIDLTDYLGNRVKMGVSEGQWEFLIINQDIPKTIQCRTISSFIHGKRCKLVLEDDLEYTYDARIIIAGVKCCHIRTC